MNDHDLSPEELRVLTASLERAGLPFFVEDRDTLARIARLFDLDEADTGDDALAG